MESVALIGLGSLITAIIGASTTALIKYLDNRQNRTRQSRQDRMDEQDKIIKRLDQEIAELRGKLEVQQSKHDRLAEEKRQCDRKYDRAILRIEHLEEALTNNNIKFRPWKEPSTDTHTPLSDEDK